MCMADLFLIMSKIRLAIWLASNEANLYKGEFFLTDVCHTFEGGILLEWLFYLQLLDRLG